jgi:hypothetical protein
MPTETAPLPKSLLLTINEMIGAWRLPPTKRWRVLLRVLEALDQAEARFPKHPVLLHRRLSCLGNALALLETRPALAKASEREQLRLRLAVDAILRVPKRFPKDSSFGAACLESFVRGHQTFARYSELRLPAWSKALTAFDRAAKKAAGAPRSHAEGRLRTAAPHQAVLTLGHAAPWMEAVRAHAAKCAVIG